MSNKNVEQLLVVARLMCNLGWVWPVLVAATALIFMRVTNGHLSDPQFIWFLILCFIGLPLMARSISCVLPVDWTEPNRWILAVLLTIPVYSFELWVAGLIFAYGALRMGWLA
jgi:hypothetical protein